MQSCRFMLPPWRNVPRRAPANLDPLAGPWSHTMPLAVAGGAAGSRPFILLASVLGLAYAGWIATGFSSAYAGSDSSGYISSARLLARGQLTTTMLVAPELTEKPWQYCVPLGFIPEANSLTLRPAYPVGYPLLLAAASRLAGWHVGPLLLNVCGALATIGLCWLISREIGVPAAWAAVGAAALACSTPLLVAATLVFSDCLSAAFCTAAFYAALRGRRSALAAVCCGAALGAAVLIRPSNLVLLPALVIVLANWRRLAQLVAGGLPAAGWLAWYNHALWGAPWRTGYGGILGIFERASLLPTLAYYAQWLAQMLPIAAAALLLLPLLPWRSRRRELLGLAVWTGAILTFYAFYPVTRDSWWHGRLILPAFPPLAILGAAGLASLAEFCRRHGHPRLAPAAGLAVLAVSVGLGGFGLCDWQEHGNVRRLKELFDAHVAMARWVDAHVPAAAIVACAKTSGTLFQHGRQIVRWDAVSPADWQAIVARVGTSGRPVYLSWDAAEPDFRTRTPGQWTRLADFAQLSVWRLDKERD